MSHTTAKQRLLRYSSWFYAAALYNFAWGSINVLFPYLLFDLIHMPRPNYPALWQVVGMFVLVYAPAYWWVAQHPERHLDLVLVGMLGKVLGPIGFTWSVFKGQLPLVFGWTILTNDLIWWPAFMAYLWDASQMSEGWKTLIKGE